MATEMLLTEILQTLKNHLEEQGTNCRGIYHDPRGPLESANYEVNYFVIKLDSSITSRTIAMLGIYQDLIVISRPEFWPHFWPKDTHQLSDNVVRIDLADPGCFQYVSDTAFSLLRCQ